MTNSIKTLKLAHLKKKNFKKRKLALLLHGMVMLGHLGWALCPMIKTKNSSFSPQGARRRNNLVSEQ